MKKLLALLTSITMLISVMPVMASAEGETVPSAYQEFVAGVNLESTGNATVNTTEQSYDMQAWGSEKNVIMTVDFGETAPESLGCIVKTGWAGNSYAMGKGMLYASIDGEIIGVIPPYNTNSFKSFVTRNFEVLRPDLCVGEKEVKFHCTQVFGKFHSFQFYTDAEGLDIGTKMYGTATEELNDSYLAYNKLTDRRYNVDFGANTKELAVKLTRTFTTDSTACAATLKLGDTVLAKIPEASATASTPLVQIVKLIDSSVCTGEQVVTLVEDGTAASEYSFTFIEIVNPYQNLLADGETIGGESYKVLNNVMFGENGTKSVDITYTGSGDLAFAFGENDTDPLSMTLDNVSSSTTQTVKFDDTNYLNGFVDTLYIMDGSGTLNITQIKFNENLLNDQFNAATSITAQYIGEGTDWYSAIKTEFEEANAQDGRTFTTDAVDLSALSTDAAKLDYVKSYTTTANIVFLQAGDYTAALLDKLVAMENAPIVMVVGTAAYAEAYGVSAITAGENALKDEANYNVPKEYVNPIYTTGIDLSSLTGGKAKYDAAGYLKDLTATSDNSYYAKYSNVDFSAGVSAVKIQYATPGTAVEMDVRIDSVNGDVIATFPAEGTGSYTTFKWVMKQANLNVTGEHDVYLCARDDESPNSWASMGNVKAVAFVPAKDDSLYTTGLDLSSPVQRTEYAHTWNSSQEKMGALHPWPSYSRFLGVNLSKGVYTITVERLETKTDIGTKLDVRVGSKDGTVLATFDQRTADEPAEQTVAVTGDYTGVQDLYLYVYNDTGDFSGNWESAFGDIGSIVFTPATTSADPIPYTDGLAAANADLNELTEIDGVMFLANDESVTYSNVVFGEEQINILKANLAATEGTLTVTSGETAIATIDLTDATGNFEGIQAMTETTLTGTMPLTVTYTGTNGCYLKGVEFINLNAYTTTLDTTNYAEVTVDVPHPTEEGKLSHLGVTVDTANGYFGSMRNNWIKWEGVNFGADAKRAVAEIVYGTNTVYSGASIEVYIDDPENPENLIATSIGDCTQYSWELKVTNTPVLLKSVTGIHDVYLWVDAETEYATSGDSSNNIYSLKFSEIASEDEYYVVNDSIMEGYKDTADKWQRGTFGKEVSVSFIKNENSPAKYALVAAAYDSTTGQLVDIETAFKDTVDGVNAAVVNLYYGDYEAGSYTYKYFLWNGTTLKPLLDTEVAEETITSVERYQAQ